jgi:hypothetical protein
MNDDVEEYLTLLHQNLEQSPLSAIEDGRYVPFVEDGRAGGEDVVKSFAREVRRSSPGSVFFLTGTRGTGKSTQMRKLQHKLKNDGFAAIWLDAEDYLNLQQPLDVVEFLFFLVGGMSDAVERDNLVDTQQGLQRGWRRLRDWLVGLPRRVSLDGIEITASAGFTELLGAEIGLKSEIRKDESFVSQMREYLEGRLSQLIEFANKCTEDIAREVREKWDGERRDPFRGVVLLVDSLDHARGAEFAASRRALIDLFDRNLDAITLDHCKTIFIVPPHLPVEYGSKRVLTNVLVLNRDGSLRPEGSSALREMICRRLPTQDLDVFFSTEKQLKEMILKSGGHLRDLLSIVREAATRTDILPITDATVSDAIRHVRAGLLPIADDERRALLRVKQNSDLPLPSQDSWFAVASLLDRHLILGYQNGEVWYGIHPLISDQL